VSFPLPEHRAEHLPSKPLLRDDTKFASAKIAFFQYLAVGIFLFLIAGFWTLQVRDPEIYTEAADRNRSSSSRCWRRAARSWIGTGG